MWVVCELAEERVCPPFDKACAIDGESHIFVMLYASFVHFNTIEFYAHGNFTP